MQFQEIADHHQCQQITIVLNINMSHDKPPIDDDRCIGSGMVKSRRVKSLKDSTLMHLQSSIPDALSTSRIFRESQSGRTWVSLSSIVDP
jgi:hypothetical protein